jgi:hypothetical protein
MSSGKETRERHSQAVLSLTSYLDRSPQWVHRPGPQGAVGYVRQNDLLSMTEEDCRVIRNNDGVTVVKTSLSSVYSPAALIKDILAYPDASQSFVDTTTFRINVRHQVLLSVRDVSMTRTIQVKGEYGENLGIFWFGIYAQTPRFVGDVNHEKSWVIQCEFPLHRACSPSHKRGCHLEIRENGEVSVHLGSVYFDKDRNPRVDGTGYEAPFTSCSRKEQLLYKQIMEVVLREEDVVGVLDAGPGALGTQVLMAAYEALGKDNGWIKEAIKRINT